ncbi:hypothetical protein [Sandaracinus amylolyticus]|uniref:hypothetical protein n=1 Tax=Sandaracinus amylolyticus TaxID=927083 RepID=UPI001F333392|nr:hypothetical protein [Sandaracinus amylolyticus]UJR82012.1 Hypothetical protein I5071_40770 [Sandaracinus amylolyticus]
MQLERLLIATLQADEPLERYFARAEEAGFALESAFEAIPFERDASGWIFLDDEEWDVPDGVVALVEHCGSIERAQRVLDRTTRFCGTDVARHVARHRAVRAAWAAIERDAPTAELARLVTDDAIIDSERVRLVEAAFRRRTALDSAKLLLALGDRAPSGVHVRWEPSQVLRALEDVGPDASRLVDALAISREQDTELALIDVYARLCAQGSRPVRDGIPFASARTHVTAWAPLLRRHGLGASAVALHLVERDPPTPTPEIARTLHEAGYGDDDVLRALLENGVRSSAALSLLGAHGWSVDRMVASLLGRAMLLSEVRDHLLALALPREAIADVLLRHAPADQVALVVPTSR